MPILQFSFIVPFQFCPCWCIHLPQEVLLMCRRNQLLGVALGGVGIGMLLACFFESGFFCCCLGVGLVMAGLCVLQKK